MLAIVMNQATKNNIDGYLVTNIPIESIILNPPPVFMEFTPLRCDATAIKTAARTNPTLYLVKKGTIIRKWGFADFDQAARFVGGMN